MVNKVYKNLNCKIDKSVSDKLEKALDEYINKYNKTGKI
jgi:hypothetical protein